jgi:peptidoglycan/LPS O-acetylase OafA/YrhL
MKHLPAIDGLRAIAVLAVVAYHAGLPVPAGFIGVDVFFVISGYVITRMLAAEHAQTGRIDFAAFYARRVRRILPALAVVVLAVLAASVVLLGPVDRLAVVKSAVAAMAVSANFHFQTVTGGYFDASADQMPLLHLWSLAVEEQFYFVWPLLLALLYRFRHSWPAMVTLAGASFWLAQTWPQEAAFYQMPSRFWELALGGLIAFLPARSRAVYAYAGLALLFLAIAVPFQPFPGTGALPACLGAALVIHAAHSGVSMPLLQLRPVRTIGLISYSLYLWHWPLLALAKAYRLDAPTLTDNLLLCGVAFILAALSYRYVETPFRRHQATKVRMIGAGVGVCALVAACAGCVGVALAGDTSLATRTALDAPQNATCHALYDEAGCADADVMLWGDSHAKAWLPYAERFGKVHSLVAPGCTPSTGDPRDNCPDFNARAVQIAKRGRIVVIGGFWTLRSNSPEARVMWSGVTKALAAVAPHVQQVILMGPVPLLPYMPQKCIHAYDIAACSVSRAEYDAKAAKSRAFLKGQAALYPNVRYVEPANFFCNATVCPMMKDGYSLYWDDDHISMSAARNFR